MAEKVYRVFMSTPLGKKYGTLAATVSGSELSGHLDILAHSEPFEGTIDPKGNCVISGVFITLMHRIPYRAAGTLTDSSVHLMMQGGQRTYELSGSLDSIAVQRADTHSYNAAVKKEETDL